MTTPRQPVPHHVRTHVEPARDSQIRIIERVHAARQVAAFAARAGSDSDGWRALAEVLTIVGDIPDLAAFARRELEGIEGVDSPPDAHGLTLLQRQAK